MSAQTKVQELIGDLATKTYKPQLSGNTISFYMNCEHPWFIGEIAIGDFVFNLVKEWDITCDGLDDPEDEDYGNITNVDGILINYDNEEDYSARIYDDARLYIEENYETLKEIFDLIEDYEEEFAD